MDDEPIFSEERKTELKVKISMLKHNVIELRRELDAM
jgi:hypothetical protein